MLVLAKSIEGQEFLYSARSARRVSARSAEKIRDAINAARWNLNEGEVWHLHEVDEYDNAFFYAERQSFTIRKGVISARNY
jgi:hypothetical protein